MKPPSGPKKQTQTNPIQTQFQTLSWAQPALSVVEWVEWANFFKGQNILPKNLATTSISYSVDIPLMESTAMV